MDNKVLEQRASLEAIIESSRGPIFSIDRHYLYTSFNSQHKKVMKQLFGTNIQIGNNILDYHSNPDDCEKAKKNIDRALNGESFDLESFVGDKEYGRRYFLISHNPVRDSNGKIIGVAVYSHDLTARKHAEKALQETLKELERSNAELQQFAYIASHDLQEPLRMVSSFTQLLEKRYKGKLDSDADDYIGYIIEGAHRMKDLIDDLLTFSRLNTDTREFKSTDLNQLIKKVLLNFKSVINDNNAQITHDPLPNLICDSSQFIQLFQNLISNALKFQGDEFPEIHISSQTSGKNWLFSIRDNGIGIDTGHKEMIFNIFKRLHTHEEYEGTGIGLAICKKVVERHGGQIWVESKPSRGSTFYFTIPKKINIDIKNG